GGSGGLGISLEEFTSPLEGLYNSRDGSSSFRNDGQLGLLTQYLDRTGPVKGTARFAVATFECDQPAPLSWYLSIAERDAMWNAIQRPAHERRLQAILKWWKERGI